MSCGYFQQRDGGQGRFAALTGGMMAVEPVLVVRTRPCGLHVMGFWLGSETRFSLQRLPAEMFRHEGADHESAGEDRRRTAKDLITKKISY